METMTADEIKERDSAIAAAMRALEEAQGRTNALLRRALHGRDPARGEELGAQISSALRVERQAWLSVHEAERGCFKGLEWRE